MISKKIKFLLGIILLLSVGLRLYRLGEIPVGHTNDEANYIYSAYSIWHTQRDLSGNYLPLSFNVFNSYSPVPIYLIVPFVGVFGLSPLVARLPFTFIGVAFIFLMFFFAKKLFNSSFIALATALILAFSPWHIQLSRMAYGASLALFFYILGIYLFLINKDKGNIAWSLPAFLLGFYSYHGTKLFFIFFIPFLILNFREEIIKRKKELLFFIFGVFLIIISFLYVSQTQDVTRQKVFIWNNFDEIARRVDNERALSSAPLQLRVVFSNKPLALFWLTRENYLRAFSLQYLFLSGEAGYNSEIYGISSKYGTFSRGMMYLIELPLLLLGLIFLLNSQKKIRNFILISLLIAPLPSALTIDQSYGVRSVMMLPFLSMIVGCGLYDLSRRLMSLKKRKLLFFYSFVTFFSLFYLFLIAEYLYQFYFRYPIYSSESWLRSRREVVEFIGKEKNNYQQVYITNPGDLLIQYAIFNRVDPKLTQTAYQSETPQVENVYFIGDCLKTNEQPFDPKIHLPESTLYITHEACHKKAVVEPVKVITEVGEPLHTIWKIYERRE